MPFKVAEIPEIRLAAVVVTVGGITSTVTVTGVLSAKGQLGAGAYHEIATCPLPFLTPAWK